MKKTIKIEVTSRNGHDELTCQSVAEARDVIQQHTEQGKWLYMDGKFSQMGNVTDQDIEGAQQIRLVSALVGG